MKPVSRTFFISSLFVSFLVANTVTNPCEAHHTKKMEGKLELAAIVNDSPAFQPVTWELSFVSEPGHVIKTLHRHRAIVELEPGHYQVKLIVNGKTYTRDIWLKSGFLKPVFIKTTQ